MSTSRRSSPSRPSSVELERRDGGYLIKAFGKCGAPGPADPTCRYCRSCLVLRGGAVLSAPVTVSGEGLREPLEFSLRIDEELDK
jgi:hypothetical protein